MKKQKLLPMIGCLALATAVYFNVKHALNDYGVRDNEKLHPAVMAQTGTTNGGTTGGGTTNNGGGSTTGNSGGTTGGSTTSDAPYCHNGGIGATSCSISAGITISVLGGVTKGGQVTCGTGYYACCSLRCTCVPNPQQSTTN